MTHLRPSEKKLLLLTIAFFVLLTSVGEISARVIVQRVPQISDTPLAYVPAGRQFALIRDYVVQRGAPDCIFFGNSLTQTGINPVVFASAFQKQTGQFIRCYNAGMDGSTMSSTASMALILSELYHPTYVIVGIQANQFFDHTGDGDPSHLAEDRFHQDSWVQYKLGNFNVEGWIQDNSRLYSLLKTYAPLIFPAQNIASPESEVLPTRPEVPRIIDSRGYRPLAGYRDASPLFQVSNNLYESAELDTGDFLALRLLFQRAQTRGFHLILVQIPIHDPPTLVGDVIDQVENLSYQNGIPFLSTDSLVPLPPSAYSDQIHLHISGSFIFSRWLGAQIGEAVSTGILSNTSAPVWSPVLERWPEPNYTAMLGLDESSYTMYLEYVDSFDLFPKDALILNPGTVELDKRFLQSLAGFTIGWENGLTQADHQRVFQLIYMLGKMRYPAELSLSPTDTRQIEQWRSTLDPSSLTGFGVDYILCREELARPNGRQCPTEIDKNPNYTFVGTWNLDPLYERYHLYRLTDVNS